MPTLLRRVLQFIAPATIALLGAACGGGGGGGSMPIANRAPVAAHDVMRADGTALDSIDVLDNDSDPDGDQLTISIEEAPPIGTATVNANGTVRLELPPTGFKGITRFSYRVTDPDGASAVATAAIFVGTDPFRVVFAGDESNDGSTEVYLADFSAPARALTAATEENMRLRGFAAAHNGATVVYRRADSTAPATTDLSFVRTDDTSQPVKIEFPNGGRPLLDAQGNDQFAVSPDGQWIAAVAGDGSTRALYVVEVSSPSNVIKASPASTAYAALPRFSLNSNALYFLASDVAGAANQSLYTVSLSDPDMPTLISAPVAASSDDVLDYSVAVDQSRILLLANRGGRVGLYFVDPLHLQTEIQMSHVLQPGEKIIASTVGLPLGSGGSAGGERAAYTTEQLLTFVRSYVAEGSTSPNPQEVAPVSSVVIGFRPDGDGLLYSRSGQVYETDLESNAADQLVGEGGVGWYDSTGNIVVLQQSLESGGSPPRYPALAVAIRETFGVARPLGTSGMAAHFIDTTGIDRGVVVIGEGATTGSAPTQARLALVNALAPDDLLYMADFDSPMDLTSGPAQVVAY